MKQKKPARMIRLLVSPSDTPLAKALGEKAIVSTIPEEKGADVLAYTSQGLLGIQRKAVPSDFISSITDGRMARETALLKQHCKFKLLLCEGRFRYYPNGRLAIDRKTSSQFTRKQIRGMLFDIRYVMGVDVDYTEDIEDTADYIVWQVDLMNQKKHLGLYHRPAVQGSWYVPTAKDIDLWLLQSFPGIGPAIADNIIRSFGGKVPLRWTCTLEELAQVDGLSRKRAEGMWEILEGRRPIFKSASEFDRLRSMIEESNG